MQVKLKKAVASELSNLEQSLQALLKNDKEELLRCVWRVATDSGYALFLFFIMRKKPLEKSSWNSTFSPKNEVGSSLKCAEDNLKENKKNIEANDFSNAHKKTLVAQDYLLKVQDIF